MIETSLDPPCAGQGAADGRVRPGRKFLALGFSLALCAAVALQGKAHADSLVLAQSGVIIGEQTDQYTIDASSAGLLDLNLTDFAWPTNPFSDLTLEIASSTQILDTLSGPGQLTIQLPGAGTYYAYVTGQAGASNFGVDIGAFGITGTLASPVPLPRSLTLLIAGILATFWLVRRKSRGDEAAPGGVAA